LKLYAQAVRAARPEPVAEARAFGFLDYDHFFGFQERPPDLALPG
jgi:hypothetical protein